MSEPMEYTGERFTPECEREIWYEHWHRYVLARDLLRARGVLDVACGEGYGADLLASAAASVVGVDIDRPTLQQASRRYRGRAHLHYLAASCQHLPFADDSFEAVVSFETIEHVCAQERMVAEIRRVLGDGGLLVLSSPNRKTYSDERNYHNPFHVKELYREELLSLLRRHFPVVRLLGQKLVFHSAIWDLQVPAPRRVDVASARRDGHLAARSLPEEAMYFVALCAASEADLPAVDGRLWLFADTGEAVTAHYEATVGRAIHLDAVLRERDQLLELRTHQMQERERLIAARDELLQHRTQQLQQREGLIEERDRLLALRTQQMHERDEELHRQARRLELAEQTLAARSGELATERARREALSAELNGLQDEARAARGRQAELEERLAQRERELAYRDSWRGWLRRPFRPLKRWWFTWREWSSP